MATWGGTPSPLVESEPPEGAQVGFFLSGRSTPFSLHTATAIFNGVPDDVLYLAYNHAIGTIDDKVVPEEPLLKFGLESRFRNEPKGETWIEWNLDYTSADDQHRMRHLAYRVSRDTHRVDWALAAPGGEIRLESAMNGREFVFDPEAITIRMGSGVLFVTDDGTLKYQGPSGRVTTLALP